MPATESRRTVTTLTAAALLPASLVGGVLVAAPFAGTTTAPLAADSRPAAAAAPARAHAQPAQPQASSAHGVGAGTWATFGLAYLALAGVGGGVLTVVARRHGR